MNDLLQGLTLLQSIIQFESKHPDYDRVNELSAEYKKIFTGTGVEEYLKKYRKNETDEMFKQMMNIYETTIPGVVDNLDTIFEKPLRSNRVFSSIEIDGKEQKKELLDKIKSFWQGQTDSGVDAYLQERWKHDVLFDPNSFIVIEFNDFNPVREKPTPFGIEYNSEQVYSFNYKQGVLDWLLIELKIMYRFMVGTEEKTKDGSKFIMYLENEAIVFTEVDEKQRLTDIPDAEFIEIKDRDNKLVTRVFVKQTFEMKSKRVPAFRVGYKLDPVTNKRTCVSNIHYALPFFKKELKSGAELDLTIRGHVFPQKYMYGPKCVGDIEKEQTCRNGYTANGTVCNICKGTGNLPVHTTAQDLIIIPFPKKGDEPVMNLQQAMAYFSPPMELVKFMEEYCYRLTDKAKSSVFPSENLMEQTTVAKTATEMDYSWDTRYDALRKFCAKYSYAWIFIIEQIAIYTDVPTESLTLYHKFPSDFKMKSAAKLLEEGKAAEDGNFPQHVKEAIHNDIANLYYADDQDTLQKIQIKNKFYPFAGKSAAEIQTILMSVDVIPYYKTLYTYFDIIFAQIDNEQGDKFYLLAFAKQEEIVKKKVEELLTKIKANKATSFLEPQQPQ